MGAAPSGRPGWPELAAWTASMASTRRALMASVSSSRSSAGGATADKRTSSSDGAGLGSCHASGETNTSQNHGEPRLPQVSHVPVTRPMSVWQVRYREGWRHRIRMRLLRNRTIGRHDGVCHLPNRRKGLPDLVAAALKIRERRYAKVSEQLSVAVGELLLDRNRRVMVE